jgi:hypothetical protein
VQVGAANATRVDLHENLIRSGQWFRQLYGAKNTRPLDLYRLHGLSMSPV